MNITTKRLQEISDGRTSNFATYAESRILAQFALDVQALPEYDSDWGIDWHLENLKRYKMRSE